jgi:hypothetical protein
MSFRRFRCSIASSRYMLPVDFPKPVLISGFPYSLAICRIRDDAVI